VAEVEAVRCAVAAAVLVGEEATVVADTAVAMVLQEALHGAGLEGAPVDMHLTEWRQESSWP
jgi:hypothetical protein